MRIPHYQLTAAQINEIVFFLYWDCFNHPAYQLEARFTIHLTQQHSTVPLCHHHVTDSQCLVYRHSSTVMPIAAQQIK